MSPELTMRRSKEKPLGDRARIAPSIVRECLELAWRLDDEIGDSPSATVDAMMDTAQEDLARNTVEDVASREDSVRFALFLAGTGCRRGLVSGEKALGILLASRSVRDSSYEFLLDFVDFAFSAADRDDNALSLATFDAISRVVVNGTAGMEKTAPILLGSVAARLSLRDQAEHAFAQAGPLDSWPVDDAIYEALWRAGEVARAERIASQSAGMMNAHATVDSHAHREALGFTSAISAFHLARGERDRGVAFQRSFVALLEDHPRGLFSDELREYVGNALVNVARGLYEQKDVEGAREALAALVRIACQTRPCSSDPETAADCVEAQALAAWAAARAGDSDHASELVRITLDGFTRAKAAARLTPIDEDAPSCHAKADSNQVPLVFDDVEQAEASRRAPTWTPPYLGRSAEWLAGACALVGERTEVERLIGEVEAGGFHISRAYVGTKARVFVARAYALQGSQHDAHAFMRVARQSFLAIQRRDATVDKITDLALSMAMAAIEIFPCDEAQEYIDALLAHVGDGAIEPGADPRFLAVAALLIQRGDISKALHLALQSHEGVLLRHRLLSLILRAIAIRVANNELYRELASDARWAVCHLDAEMPSESDGIAPVRDAEIAQVLGILSSLSPTGSQPRI